MVRNSPSSINMYNQCPRLYYYQYIEKKPSFPHIDLVRGEVVHKTLQEFFSLKPSIIDTNYNLWASQQIRRIFMKCWDSRKETIRQLNLSDEELKQHYEECIEIINHWLSEFLKKTVSTGLPFSEAFAKLKPVTEDEVYLKKYDIKGFIDVIENVDGEIRIIDYKTSSKFEITREHKLQLAIYAFLYEKKYGKKPDKVGIYFLKEGLRLIAVDDAMINFAEEECKKIHEKTKSKEIKDYPQNTGYLCKALGEKCPCHKYEGVEEDD